MNQGEVGALWSLMDTKFYKLNGTNLEKPIVIGLSYKKTFKYVFKNQIDVSQHN